MKRTWKWNTTEEWVIQPSEIRDVVSARTWLLRKERHKSHLMVLFIHEEAGEVIADTFFSCHFYAIMSFSCWYQLRRRALNNRYQLKQNAQLNVISVSGRRRETLIMIIKMFKIISADERGVGFWRLVRREEEKCHRAEDKSPAKTRIWNYAAYAASLPLMRDEEGWARASHVSPLCFSSN